MDELNERLAKQPTPVSSWVNGRKEKLNFGEICYPAEVREEWKFTTFGKMAIIGRVLTDPTKGFALRQNGVSMSQSLVIENCPSAVKQGLSSMIQEGRVSR